MRMLILLILMLSVPTCPETALIPLTENQVLGLASQVYGCQYELLYAIRKAENGRKGFEFGIPDSMISTEVRENWPQEHWQYYQAAKAVRAYQDRFIKRHITLFARHSVSRWVGRQHKERHGDWVRNVVYHYKRCKP